MSIGDLIHIRRTELNLTLEEIGNAVGVSKSTVKKWEDGFISNMRRDKISSLAKVLQLNPVSLITGEIINLEQKNNFYISDHEKQVILAYRQQPELSKAVDRVLNIPEEIVEKNTPKHLYVDKKLR